MVIVTKSVTKSGRIVENGRIVESLDDRLGRKLKGRIVESLDDRLGIKFLRRLEMARMRRMSKEEYERRIDCLRLLHTLVWLSRADGKNKYSHIMLSNKTKKGTPNWKRFEVGVLQRSVEDGNYYISVLDECDRRRTEKIEINGSLLRNPEYAPLVKHADDEYNRKKTEHDNQETQRREVRRYNLRQGLACLVGGAIVSLVAYLGYNHYTSPEYMQRKVVEKAEVERRERIKDNSEYIVPPSHEKRVYSLKNGGKVEILHHGGFFDANEGLVITLDDKVKFFSGVFSGLSYDDDTKRLDKIQIWEGGEWSILPGDKIKDYGLWQRMYEDLILGIAEAKHEFERNEESVIKRRLYSETK